MLMMSNDEYLAGPRKWHYGSRSEGPGHSCLPGGTQPDQVREAIAGKLVPVLIFCYADSYRFVLCIKNLVKGLVRNEVGSLHFSLVQGILVSEALRQPSTFLGDAH